MGTRMALEPGKTIRFDGCEGTYKVRREMGRGASCVVYEAVWQRVGMPDKTVILRELNPLAAEYGDVSDADRERFVRAYNVCCYLYEQRGLTNASANMQGLYEANDTLYVVTAYNEGKALDHIVCETMECAVRTARSVADTVRKIHELGLLHLDIKPENIFAFSDTCDVIQFFDFDSLTPIDDCGKVTSKEVYFTRKYAAPELREGDWTHIGPHTDVYSIGAVLFYLVFGRAPDAFDCESKAVYDYGKSLYSEKLYRDRLYIKLTDFFHHTLAAYYPDRYRSAGEAVLALDELVTLADETKPYIRGGFARSEKGLRVIGRSSERAELSEWLMSEDDNCLFVTGMGGIGKSTLVRSVLAEIEGEFDYVVYLNYTGDIRHTIADDLQLAVSTVLRTPEETEDEYFDRKLRALARITEGTQTIVVMDNYEDEPDEAFTRLLGLDIKLLVVTRRSADSCTLPGSGVFPYRELRVRAFSNRDSLYELIEMNMGRRIRTAERTDVDRLIDCVCGHTLALALIGRQIAFSDLSIHEAVKLAEEHGFSEFAHETVMYVRDGVVRQQRVREIIEAVFAVGYLSEIELAVLHAVALTADVGFERRESTMLLGTGTLEIVNSLLRKGWLENFDERILVHPVIREMTSKMAMVGESLRQCEDMMRNIASRVTEYNSERGRMTESVIVSADSHEELWQTAAYEEFLCEMLILFPKDRGEFVTSHTEQMTEPYQCPAAMLVELCDYVAYLYLDKGDAESAERIIEKAYALAKGDCYLMGICHDMKADYYDYILAGNYYAQTRGARRYARLLMGAQDKSVSCMRRAMNSERYTAVYGLRVKLLLARYLTGKVMVAVRAGKEDKHHKTGGVLELLGEADALLTSLMETDEKTKKPVRSVSEDEISEVRQAVYLAYAWYYTYTGEIPADKSSKMARKYIALAEKTAAGRDICALDMIDGLLMPCANIMLELGEPDKSERWLRHAIDICDERREFAPYIRRREELFDCMAEVINYNDKPE